MLVYRREFDSRLGSFHSHANENVNFSIDFLEMETRLSYEAKRTILAKTRFRSNNTVNRKAHVFIVANYTRGREMGLLCWLIIENQYLQNF